MQLGYLADPVAGSERGADVGRVLLLRRMAAGDGMSAPPQIPVSIPLIYGGLAGVNLGMVGISAIISNTFAWFSFAGCIVLWSMGLFVIHIRSAP